MSKSLTVSTTVLKELVNKAVKACSLVPEILPTTVVEIKLESGVLSVTGTDTNNYVTLFKNDVVGEDFRVAASAKLLSQLVSKITTQNITLTLTDSKLLVEGNGKYSIELKIDEFGNTVTFPELPFDDSVESKQITSDQLKSVLTVSKSCKSDMKEAVILYNYYFDSEKILTTDLYKACINPVAFFNVPVCLPPRLVELIPLVADEAGVTVQLSGDAVLFSSTRGRLYGKTCHQEDTAQYPEAGLVQLFGEQMEYSVRVSRTSLASALDRLLLVNGAYGNNVIKFVFNGSYLELKNERAQSSETLNYFNEPLEISATSIDMDGTCMYGVISSQMSEDLTLGFNLDASGIQLGSDDIMISVSAVEV